ncbi:MAG: DUF3035 domain-containing protein [Rhodobacteraceae bacterium]|nr:DUF3035 domain-containing protein [Paracoccaceae bacterium]
MNKGLCFLVVISIALGGCSRNNSEPELVFHKSRGAPDELTLVVYEPIEKPESIAALAPPGTTRNAADPQPNEDIIRLLGSDGEEKVDGRIPDRDSDLLLYTQRMGADGDIRGILAAEDLEFRRRNQAKPLERLANINVYFAAYSFMALDSREEYQRLRSEGVIP